MHRAKLQVIFFGSKMVFSNTSTEFIVKVSCRMHLHQTPVIQEEANDKTNVHSTCYLVIEINKFQNYDNRMHVHVFLTDTVINL